ncbi:Uncharacterised protein [Mycobacteroides abscessus]|nr:Uncharacterised protein [Mycobacteroides abscessus]
MSPSPRSTTTRSKRGALSASTSVPGVVGYRPMAAHTYQPAWAPRSSLPGLPFGSGRNSVDVSSSTSSLVRHGWPT